MATNNPQLHKLYPKKCAFWTTLIVSVIIEEFPQEATFIKAGAFHDVQECGPPEAIILHIISLRHDYISYIGDTSPHLSTMQILVYIKDANILSSLIYTKKKAENTKWCKELL